MQHLYAIHYILCLLLVGTNKYFYVYICQKRGRGMVVCILSFLPSKLCPTLKMEVMPPPIYGRKD